MTVRVYDAAVVGGGLHGLSSALQLARRGLKVVLLERTRIGRHSSGASAAGVRTRGRARAELPASLVSMEMWHHIADLVGDDCGFHADGQLQVAETEVELEQLRVHVAALRADGFTNEEVVEAAELRELVPTIAPHCVGGSFARRDGAADPHRTIVAFLRSAREASVVVEEGWGVATVERVGDVWRLGDGSRSVEAPLVVNAAGAWAGIVAQLFGDEIPIGTKASMMIVTERVAPFVRPTVSSHGRALSFKQTSQGTLLIGGGVQGRPNLDSESYELDTRALSRSASAAVALFPGATNLRVVRAWAGLEAKTSDNVAIVGLSPSSSGVMHLFGFSGHGFQLVPVLGLAAAELLLDGSTGIDLSGLAPQRLMTSGERDIRAA